MEEVPDQTFRPCGRAFFVYYVAMFICFLGPAINPAVGLPAWLGFILGLVLVAAVIYLRWGEEYHLTTHGLIKVWLWPKRRQEEIAWENLGEVVVRRGMTQSLLGVGNLAIQDKKQNYEMLWSGLSHPQEVKALIERRRREMAS